MSPIVAEHVIERVAGKEAYSFLDRFSGYNQVSIDPKDQHKMAFATEWGIFAYRVMPFGLTNALATFQRLMSHAFKEYLSGISLRYIWMLGGVTHKYVSVSRGFNRRDFLIPFFTHFLHTEGCHLKGVFTVE